MPPFLYRCPHTGDNVQAWAADDPEDDDLTYVQVSCLACAQAHLVNPKNGKVRRRAAENLLTRDEGRVLAANSLRDQRALRRPR